MSGIRVHWPVLQANARNMQMVKDVKNALSLGALDFPAAYRVNDAKPLSQLGVSLKWNDGKKSMETDIIRGMPYATMQYSGGVLPTVYSDNGLASDIVVDDGEQTLECGEMVGKKGSVATVKQFMKLHFINSDFTWMLFFSQPVEVRCAMSEGDEKLRSFQLDVVSYEAGENDLTLTVKSFSPAS